MDTDALIHKMALALIPGIGAAAARALTARFKDPAAIFCARKRDLMSVPGIGTRLAERIVSRETYRRAEEEVRFIEREKIGVKYLEDTDYPEKLLQCPDPPVLFFFKGELPAGNERALSIVGTRNPTDRGIQWTRKLVEELADFDRSILIVSGLAYGIDIEAHQAALEAGMKTVAALGHGFHTIYPAVHRPTAHRILHQGALITDFFSHSRLEPKNFIRRNRIIAGLSEATVVVESGIRGGAMVTAEMAVSYNRDLLAVPGRPGDAMSAGCNHLIRTNQAGLVESAADLLFGLGWSDCPEKASGIQPRLFPSLTEEEKRIFDLLGEEPLGIDRLSRLVQMPVHAVSAILLTLEIHGLAKNLPGRFYIRAH